METVALRVGLDLVLSRIDAATCPFHFEEPDDIFGIGLHLKGGSAFEMEGERFKTRPLDVWAGAAPRGSSSTFSLPKHGFHTVSLRFSPDAIRDLLERHGQQGSVLDNMARMASEHVSVARLAPLDTVSARLVDAMFAAPYIGAARTLFLESCALALLAAQIDAHSRIALPMPAAADNARMQEARACLDARLDDPPSIIELARLMGINDFKLKRSFKAAFGTTVFGYVRQRRMERAASQLHAGLAVANAAHDAGYACPRCFADAFRRHYGMLPSEMARTPLVIAPACYG